jgi:hypothetical protein
MLSAAGVAFGSPPLFCLRAQAVAVMTSPSLLASFGGAIALTLKCERANADHPSMETATATFTGGDGRTEGWCPRNRIPRRIQC